MNKEARTDYKWIIILVSIMTCLYIIGLNEMTMLKVESLASPKKEVAMGSSDTGNQPQEEHNNHTNYDEVVKSPFPKHSDVIYGHLHMGKTGGTALNGILANTFERVCGHKGYSYDAYQANERFKKQNNSLLEGWSRDRVELSIIDEIGFEDCDYVSLEDHWSIWPRKFSNFHNMTMELHVPCRDPIDHLMSQCNHYGRKFKCGENITLDNIIYQTRKCYQGMMRRFSYFLKRGDNINLKCYDFRQQFTGYMDYMSTKLQRKRIVSDYVTRETNKPRKKEEECIWKDKELQQRVREHLITKPALHYWRFCNECIGSDDDIFNKGLV